MSNTGMNLNVYDTTGHYLTLLNDFSIAIKEAPEKITEASYQQIIDLFSVLENEENIDPQAQMLSVVIEQELRKQDLPSDTFFKSLSRDLKSKSYNKIIDQLNCVIEALDTEFSMVLSKMNGNS